MLKYAEDPVILHELLHAYHNKLMAQGFDNLGIKAMYAQAVSKNVMPKEEYAMMNPQEFFAVTASVFLAGKGTVSEPHTRAQLKEKMPKYYKFLVELFGFDPEPSSTPVAETSAPQPPSAAMAPGGT
jgi:Mlc titration factor MtfA (ptsG expression regulator)